MSPFQPSTANTSSWNYKSTRTDKPAQPVYASINKAHIQDRITELSQGFDDMNLQGTTTNGPRRQITSVAPDAYNWGGHRAPSRSPDLPNAGANPYAASPLSHSSWDASTVPYTLPEWAQPRGVKMRAVKNEVLFSPEGSQFPPGVGDGFGFGCGAQMGYKRAVPRWVGGGNGRHDEMFDARTWS